MRFIYIGNPYARDDTGSVTLFGHTFPLNVPVDVTNERAIGKLSGNGHFRRADADAAVEAPNVAEPDAQSPSGDLDAAPVRTRRRAV